MDSFDNMFGDVVFINQEDFIHHNTDSELEPLWSNVRTPEVPDATVTSTFEEPEAAIPEDVSQLIDDILAEQDNQDNTITSTENGMDDVAVINNPNDDINIMEVPIIIDEMDMDRHDIEVLHEFSLPDAPTSNSSSEASAIINKFLSSVRSPIPIYELSPVAPSPPSYDYLSLLSPTSSHTSGSNLPSPSQIYIPALENGSQIALDAPQIPHCDSLPITHLPVHNSASYTSAIATPVVPQISINVVPLPLAATSSSPIPQEPIPSTSSDTESYIKMRDKNNESCQKYRQRRKNKLQELEKEKEALKIRNRELKIELKFQELYVKKFKFMVLNKVKPKQQNKNTNLNELLVQAGIADLVTPNEFCPGCVTGDCSRIDCPNKR